MGEASSSTLPLRLLVAAALLAHVATTTSASVSAAPKSRSRSCYGRLFSFGDSLTDTGNFIHYSNAPGSVSRPPYGETFFGRPTGRWSDGRLVVDFIVEKLGFPYWPAYLQAKSPATKDEFRYGANFAVASGTALSQQFFQDEHLNVSEITPYSLGVQIGWFKKVLATIASTDEEREEVMARSLFLVGEIGANDYNHPLFQNKTIGWVRPLVPWVVRSIGLSIEALIDLGAKTIYVPGVFPLGCVPRYLFFFRGSEPGDYDSAGCLKWLNDLTILHNDMLKAKIDELRRDHPGMSITYVEQYDEFLSIIIAPARNGFDVDTVLDACCGGGGPHNANFTIHCSEPGAVQCPDPSKYVSWDGLHLTEAMYKIMARGMLLDGPLAAPLPTDHGPDATTDWQ
ncbi:GDSL esterase/lipase At5g45910-like [Lolium perenne]|uniref:GDSL esterase/lipase At5g45910-like n=1 Tax=Lolium perenne TaxID=4522 RepID=UPI0021F5EF51|nr:GDSL esterase/lipase At5g45910-like [Lolium perenne]